MWHIYGLGDSFDDILTTKNLLDMAGILRTIPKTPCYRQLGLITELFTLNQLTRHLSQHRHKTSTICFWGNAVGNVSGERIDTGIISALCPDGWKSYDVADYFSDDDDAIDPTRLEFHKGAQTPDDQFFKPGIDISYYDKTVIIRHRNLQIILQIVRETGGLQSLVAVDGKDLLIQIGEIRIFGQKKAIITWELYFGKKTEERMFSLRMLMCR